MRIVLHVATVFLCALHSPIAGAKDERSVPFLVSTQWLAGHLNDPNVVVLQICTNRREYNRGHIPGARFVWGQAFAPSNPDASSELPTIEQAKDLFEEFGVSNNSHIVVCANTNRPTWPTRLFFTFESFGLGDQTSILDGGFDLWKKENRAVSTEATNPAKGKVTLAPTKEFLVDGGTVNALLNDASVNIIDARDKRFYDGADAGQSRSGHIPNAVNIPYTTCLDSTGNFKDRALLAQMFTGAGVKPGNRVITYCHIGQQATVVYVVARLLGYDARVYDGSFEDWSGTESYPVVNPSAKTEGK